MHPFTSNITSITFLIILSLLHLTKTTSFSGNDILPNCTQPFSCGHLTNLTYPFSGGPRPPDCGLPGLNLSCVNDTTILTSGSLNYRVNQVNETKQTITLSRLDLYNSTCTQHFNNTALNTFVFSLTSSNENLTLFYGCNSTLNALDKPANLFYCDIDGVPRDAYYLIGPVPSDPILYIVKCNFIVSVPIFQSRVGTLLANRSLLGDALRDGFEVAYADTYRNQCEACRRRLGRECGFDPAEGRPICICGDRLCPDKSSNKVSLPIGLSIAGAVIVGIFLGCWLLVIAQRRKRKAATETQSKELLSPPPINKNVHIPTADISLSIPPYPYSISKPKSDLEKGSSFFGVQVFSFTELEEATDNFDPSKELGSGGFGTVYYGILRDGRSVAVKRLFENNMKRAEQFMNEVEILNRLRHKNLVTLYGCTSRRSRELILVYEYIPNGTVADHLHRGASNSGLLSWPVRFSIAVETADALAYLHASDVIHRDVKTNNILLDNKFRVKVADFGLSRLFPTNVTHVSTAPQGTPGYVDPEYYHTYQLTDKSDVYSFGVVLIELISSLPAVDTSRHRQDVNLANMAISKIQNHSLSELVDPVLGFDKDTAVRKMATSVAALAFRCLQQERDIRPTMDEVLQALKKIESENYGFQNARVLDIGEDDVGLLKPVPPTLSPDSDVA